MKGFFIRLVIATAIAAGVWWLIITPFNRQPLPQAQFALIVPALNFPVALAGELFYPERGIALVTDDGGSWCCFCSPAMMTWRQLRIAIPAYLFVLYLPAIIRFIARDRRLLLRVITGLLIYAAGIALFSDFLGLVRESKWFLILACAATIAWAKLAPELRIAAMILVLLDGAWILRNIDALWRGTSGYFAHLATVVAAVATLLLLVWLIEHCAERLQILHPRVAHDRDDGGAAA
ncbi:MAG TPA: hypothetical protein VJ901_20880 [Thermoanaerobaculia bacterium]|nr:hypothetical protein [Thermoanaerobaculia bacterium]